VWSDGEPPAVGTDVDDGVVQRRVKKDRIAMQSPDLQAGESTSTADASNRTPAASLVIARQKLGFRANLSAGSAYNSINARLLLAIVMRAKGAA